MTIAAQLIGVARNANDAIARAEELTDDINQDWAHEATLFEFDDGSVLVVSGSQCNEYDSMPEAVAALEV